MNEADETRERVRTAAEDLDSGSPDPRASSLRQGPSGIVGVIAEGRLLNSFSDPSTVSVLHGLAQHLDQNSSGILLIPAQGSDGREVVRRMSGIPPRRRRLPARRACLGGGARPPAPSPHPARRHGLPRDRVCPAANDGRARRDTQPGHAPVRPRPPRRRARRDAPGCEPRRERHVADGQPPGRAHAPRASPDVFPDAHVVRAAEAPIEGGFRAAEKLFTRGASFTALAAQSERRSRGARGAPEGRPTSRTHTFALIEGTSTAAPAGA